MNREKALWIAVFCLLTFIRGYFRIKHRTLCNRRTIRAEGLRLVLFRSSLGLMLLIASLDYVFSLDLLSFGFLPLHAVPSTNGNNGPTLAVRNIPLYSGLTISGVALGILVSAHLALGENFSTTAEIKSTQRLVTSGIYRYIRNPMYLAYCLLFMGSFLLSGNWIISGTGLSIIGSLMTFRLKKEEAMLALAFGDSYLKYRKSTGAFFPRIGTVTRAGSFCARPEKSSFDPPAAAGGGINPEKNPAESKGSLQQ